MMTEKEYEMIWTYIQKEYDKLNYLEIKLVELLGFTSNEIKEHELYPSNFMSVEHFIKTLTEIRGEK